jgi:hypothetical protein
VLSSCASARFSCLNTQYLPLVSAVLHSATWSLASPSAPTIWAPPSPIHTATTHGRLSCILQLSSLQLVSVLCCPVASLYMIYPPIPRLSLSKSRYSPLLAALYSYLSARCVVDVDIVCSANISDDPNGLNCRQRPKILSSVLQNIGNTPLVDLSRLAKSVGLKCQLCTRCVVLVVFIAVVVLFTEMCPVISMTMILFRIGCDSCVLIHTHTHARTHTHTHMQWPSVSSSTPGGV